MTNHRESSSTYPGTSALATCAADVIRLSYAPQVSVADLQQLVETDKAFLTTLVAVARSRAFGVALQTTNLDQVCAELGVRGLRNAALIIALTEKAPRSTRGGAVLASCLRGAVASQLLAERLSAKDQDRSSKYFTAGLLLEARLVIMAESDMDLAVRLAEGSYAQRMQNGPQPAVSAAIAEQLGADSELVYALRHHEDGAPPAGKISKQVWAGKRIAALWEGGDLTRAHFEALAALRLLGLPEGTLRELTNDLPCLVADAARVLGRYVPRLASVDVVFGSGTDTIPAQPNTDDERNARGTSGRQRQSALERQLVEFRQHLLAGVG